MGRDERSNDPQLDAMSAQENTSEERDEPTFLLAQAAGYFLSDKGAGVGGANVPPEVLPLCRPAGENRVKRPGARPGKPRLCRQFLQFSYSSHRAIRLQKDTP